MALQDIFQETVGAVVIEICEIYFQGILHDVLKYLKASTKSSFGHGYAIPERLGITATCGNSAYPTP
jgi:hypothetical protein